MTEKKGLIKTKKQMFLVIGVFALILLLGTASYAFFNYTRTGESNTVSTGRIAFSSNYTAVNLANAFPITSQEASDASNPNVRTISISVTGDTDYSEGMEYLITATDVNMTTGTKSMPLTMEVGVESNTENNPATTLGSMETGRAKSSSGSVNNRLLLSRTVELSSVASTPAR